MKAYCRSSWPADRGRSHPARGLPNRLVQSSERSATPPLPWPYQSLAAKDVHRASAARDGEYAPLLAGQALRLLKPDQQAAEVVAELVHDAEPALAAPSR